MERSQVDTGKKHKQTQLLLLVKIHDVVLFGQYWEFYIIYPSIYSYSHVKLQRK